MEHNNNIHKGLFIAFSLIACVIELITNGYGELSMAYPSPISRKDFHRVIQAFTSHETKIYKTYMYILALYFRRLQY